jgi:peroxiredoxin
LKYLHILFLSLLFSCTNPGHSIEVNSITLQTTNKKAFPLSELTSSKIKVFYFLSPECPSCRGYSLTMRNLFNQYLSQNIQFIGVVPGTDFTNEEIDDYKKTYQIPFEIYKDEKKELVKMLHATVTPEAFLIVNDEVKYHGKIDNWVVSPAVKRQVVTEHYLDNALQSVIKNKEIKTKATDPVGCFIE